MFVARSADGRAGAQHDSRSGGSGAAQCGAPRSQRPARMIVIKFGGTSVGDSQRVANAIDIVADRQGQFPIVVVSALAGVTNELVAATEAARECDIDRV